MIFDSTKLSHTYYCNMTYRLIVHDQIILLALNLFLVIFLATINLTTARCFLQKPLKVLLRFPRNIYRLLCGGHCANNAGIGASIYGFICRRQTRGEVKASPRPGLINEVL